MLGNPANLFIFVFIILCSLPKVLIPLWSELQPKNNITKAMAACDPGSDDNHLSEAEWYWGNISR